MPFYLEYNVMNHPKFVRAGELLGGEYGAARAFTLWAAALSYAREHMTDGKVPHGFLSAYPYESSANAVAKVLADRRVRLWHRTRDGWRIHNYRSYNRSAKEIKTLRERNRERQSRFRARHAGGNGAA